MKKIIVLLSILLFFVSGCSIRSLSSTDIDKNIDIILSEKVELANVHFDGYKYYLPKGMKFINKDEYNALLTDRYHNKYYLYVDAISYYHQVENTYKVDKDVYYSKKLNYNKKTGYIEISQDKEQEKYFIQFVFNYSKVEVYVDKDSLVDAVNNICYVLQSIKFNDKVLESLIGENILNYKEETFNIFDSKSSKDSSLQFDEYVEEFDNAKEKHLPDEDTFEVEEID